MTVQIIGKQMSRDVVGSLNKIKSGHGFVSVWINVKKLSICLNKWYCLF